MAMSPAPDHPRDLMRPLLKLRARQTAPRQGASMNARTEAEAEAPRWQDEVYDTSLGVDLERIAAGSGIKRTAVVEKTADLADGARLLREGNGTAFVLLRVKPSEPPSFKRDLDPALPGTLQ